ncbi:MAG: hypothetical protein HQL46_09125 [Gammaproteobacteria bacterium]|nr:hypothetical protein [Gammaproteobacteria bacterium]
MAFDIPEQQRKKAKVPHDWFLANLIVNHILIFVGTLSMASSWAWPMLIVPIISLSVLFIIFFKGNKSKITEPWFVMCHWQLARKRSLLFISLFFIFGSFAAIGMYGYYELGWMKEAVYATVGGMSILPIMVTTLILILMESDALHQADLGKLPHTLIETYPKPDDIKEVSSQ